MIINFEYFIRESSDKIKCSIPNIFQNISYLPLWRKMFQYGQIHFKNLLNTSLFIILSKIITCFNGFYNRFKSLKIPSTSMTKASPIERVVILAHFSLKGENINLLLSSSSGWVREDTRPYGFSNGKVGGRLNRLF